MPVGSSSFLGCSLTGDELRYIPNPAGIYGSDFPSETFRILKNTGLTLAPLSVGWVSGSVTHQPH